ncbi:MAG TPA: UDP-glucose/GDP-mannose dehydrogenase family protein [Syntrophales bacterium]|mgnify:CR=1 FL=1|nr:UDP-glucose/GDP-mannose dehydrogenase family protein [Syntrophales bacterium]HQN78072.1 UDP-glucose/GDP-mannose dehydrogenase family protein [Syntrophales bacterium]
MKISIFGLGYVGCVSMGCLAKNGHTVVGVDVSRAKIETIQSGKSPIVEAEIDEIISDQHRKGLISATDNGIEAVTTTDVSFICVGTPSTPNGHLDLDTVFRVAGEIGKGIERKNGFHVVVIRSTVLPGTNEKVTAILEERSGKKHDVDFAVVSNPEFLREGTAVKDYYEPSFTLVGSSSARATDIMKEVYKEIHAPFITAEIRVAEMMKYVNNAFHALKITFANEIGNVCKKLDIDSHRLMEIFCLDRKLNLSPYYLKPGFAYGGSCLPKDLKALKTVARDLYIDCPVLENIERSNEIQKKMVLDRILAFDRRHVGFLGLSFKAGTDDLRNSPIVDIIEQLIGKGFKVRIFDRNVRLSQLIGANREYILQKIPYISQFITDDPAEIINHSDIIVVVNKEKEFKDILEKIDGGKQVFDLVNLDYERNVDTYHGISW